MRCLADLPATGRLGVVLTRSGHFDRPGAGSNPGQDLNRSGGLRAALPPQRTLLDHAAFVARSRNAARTSSAMTSEEGGFCPVTRLPSRTA
jgi:hypothetical protein